MLKSTTLFWRWLTLFIIIILWKAKFVLLFSQQSNFCEPKDVFCDEKNGNVCYMKYYKLNSTNCLNLAFNDSLHSTNSDLGDFEIKPYLYSLLSYKQTGFNISFSNISWSNLKFRFKQKGNEIKNSCREFYISLNSTLKNIFYDCLWSNETYEGKTFSFEYETTNGISSSYKQYTFRVPYAKNIEESTDLANWEIFVFVEHLRNAFGLTTFILHWQPLPAKFSQNTYNISIYSNESGQLEVTYSTNVTCNNVSDCKYYYNKWYGTVQFGIQHLCINGSQCFLSKTAVFSLGGDNTKPLLIGIVSTILIVPAFLYFLFFLKNYFVRKSSKLIQPVPKLLVIFTPSLSSHVNVVFGLVEYLRMYCNVEPLVDELHIFLSKSRDPFKWCNETFKSADFIMVVASPFHKHLRLADSVYRNTDVLLLRLLTESLSSRENKKKYFVLMLPYCSENDIFSEAINLKRFYFPEDLNKMLKFIHKDRSLCSCCVSEIQGRKEHYKLLGSKLRNSISETQAALKKNKCDYERMIAEMNVGRGDDDSNQALLLCAQDDVMRERSERSERRTREKQSAKELAEEIFMEFPGRLDDLNLSG